MKFEMAHIKRDAGARDGAVRSCRSRSVASNYEKLPDVSTKQAHFCRRVLTEDTQD